MPLIPTADIDDHALPRDRTNLDPTALQELRLSIATHGLRTPIEVFLTQDGYALISGFRRLTAYRALHTLTQNPAYATINATILTPATIPEALTLMVEENDIRADLSPWEKGRIAVEARNQGHFETIDAAIAALYPAACKMRRSRLRALALLVEELDGTLTTPETLSQRQALRLASALRGGFTALIRTALEAAHTRTPEADWALLQPILDEAEQSLKDPTPYRPGYPRRYVRLRPGLTVRRELAVEGWVLRFTGPEATGMLMETVMDEVERMVRRE
jgi:ParB family transcriptional regulator, chromosome partitioning protein